MPGHQLLRVHPAGKRAYALQPGLDTRVIRRPDAELGLHTPAQEVVHLRFADFRQVHHVAQRPLCEFHGREERASVASMVHLDVAVARILLAGLLECDESLATRGELNRRLERRHDAVQ